jgi:hypothetical protein
MAYLGGLDTGASIGASCSTILTTLFEFSIKSRLIRGLAILIGYNPEALYPTLML